MTQETFKPGEEVLYISCGFSNRITLERAIGNDVVATSGSFGDMGPFLMRFDSRTGEGVGQYVGSKIEKIVE